MRRMIEDKQTAAAIDKIVSRMRDVVDELAFDERRQVLLSIRAISGDIADRPRSAFKSQSLRRSLASLRGMKG